MAEEITSRKKRREIAKSVIEKVIENRFGNKENVPEKKTPGYKSTEFALAIATIIVVLLSEIFNFNLSLEKIGALVTIVIGYVTSRTMVKRKKTIDEGLVESLGKQ